MLKIKIFLLLLMTGLLIGPTIIKGPTSLISLQKRVEVASGILFGTLTGSSEQYLDSRMKNVFVINMNVSGLVGNHIGNFLDDKNHLQIYVPGKSNPENFKKLLSKISDSKVILFVKIMNNRLWVNNFTTDHYLVSENTEGKRDILSFYGQVYRKNEKINFVKLNQYIREHFSGDLMSIDGKKLKLSVSELKKKYHFHAGRSNEINLAEQNTSNEIISENNQTIVIIFLILLLLTSIFVVFHLKIKRKKK